MTFYSLCCIRREWSFKLTSPDADDDKKISNYDSSSSSDILNLDALNVYLHFARRKVPHPGSPSRKKFLFNTICGELFVASSTRGLLASYAASPALQHEPFSVCR